MEDNGRSERIGGPTDSEVPGVALGFRRSVLVLVVLAFIALVAAPLVFGGDDGLDTPAAPVPIPEETTSTVSTTVTTTSSTLVLSDKVSESEEPLPRVSASFRLLDDIPFRGSQGQSVVWTGSEIIAWGGFPDIEAEASVGGAVIDPETGTWRAMSDPPIGQRFGHTAVWAGDRMIVWGGFIQVDEDGGFPYREGFADGATYDPKLDRWTQIPEAPIGRQENANAVWTGTEMIIIGSQSSDDTQRSDGKIPISAAAFDPELGSWRLLADVAVLPVSVYGFDTISAVWTGQAVVVSGAAVGADAVAVYRPDIDEWDLVAIPLGARSGFSSVWTGNEVIFWGGTGIDAPSAVGYALNPETSQWRSLPPPPVVERAGHGAVWTGGNVLMWGGTPVRPFIDSSERFAFGVLYDPQTDIWTQVDVEDPRPNPFDPGFELAWLGDSALLWSPFAGRSGILTPGGMVPSP